MGPTLKNSYFLIYLGLKRSTHYWTMGIHKTRGYMRQSPLLQYYWQFWLENFDHFVKCEWSNQIIKSNYPHNVPLFSNTSSKMKKSVSYIPVFQYYVSITIDWRTNKFAEYFFRACDITFMTFPQSLERKPINLVTKMDEARAQNCSVLEYGLPINQ